MSLAKNDLLSLVATNLADNTDGDITPAKVRQVDEQIIDANANLEELTLQTFKGPIAFDGDVTGAAATDNLTGGWANYQDLATQTTLFNVVGGAAAVKIPNDGDGAFTLEGFLPLGVNQLYNKVTEQIDLTDLSVGDMFTLRFDLEVTTSANSQEVEISATFAIGSPSEFTSVIAQGSKKLSGSVRFFREVSFAAFNSDFKDFPAEVKISSDGNCTVKVNGYFLKTTLIGR